MRIVIVTAGGAGMYCGSCIADNTWARALRAAGADALLLPCYTPLRVDDEILAGSRIYLGGINLYLEHKYRWWRRLPRGWRRWVDSPWVIRQATRFGVSNDAAELGDLTMSLLAGEHGPSAAAVEELGVSLARDFKPDVIVFSNLLMSGLLPTIRRHCDVPIVGVLQGDDIFLDALPAAHQAQVIRQIHDLSGGFDAILTHSRYYQEHMSAYLGLPADQFRHIPLAIDCSRFGGVPRGSAGERPTLGFFARICPEKGLHNLVAAAALLQRRGVPFRLRVAGYLAPRHRPYLHSQLAEARRAGIDVGYDGSPDGHDAKEAFLKSLDLLSVPTEYREPKGLYVLEALASGVPVVQPAVGAFPELLESTGGGLLVPPENDVALADGLERLLTDDAERLARAQTGWQRVREAHGLSSLAQVSLREFETLCAGHGPRGT